MVNITVALENMFTDRICFPSSSDTGAREREGDAWMAVTSLFMEEEERWFFVISPRPSRTGTCEVISTTHQFIQNSTNQTISYSYAAVSELYMSQWFVSYWGKKE